MRDQTKTVMTPKPNMNGFRSLAPAVHRASTIVFPTAEAYANRSKLGPDGYSYGLYGTPTTRQLATKITEMYGATRTLLAPSGQAANAIAIMALVKSGDHVLLPDSVYPSMRYLAREVMEPCGITTEYYHPTLLHDLQRRIRPETKIIWTESPGSSTLEVQDLPAIAELARKAGALTGCDNTWATSLALKPFALGIDIVTEALTKYAGGHSDLLMGSISVADEQIGLKIRAYMGSMGLGVSPDDAALVLRGMETMALRFERSFEGAQRLVKRIEPNPAIDCIIWPAMPSSPDYALWKRDFRGAAGVFSVLLKEGVSTRLDAALDALQVFSIGASWGGTRSLIAPMSIAAVRSVEPWAREDLVLRISVGIEDLDDLEADIDRFLTALNNQ